MSFARRCGGLRTSCKTARNARRRHGRRVPISKNSLCRSRKHISEVSRQVFRVSASVVISTCPRTRLPPTRSNGMYSMAAVGTRSCGAGGFRPVEREKARRGQEMVVICRRECCVWMARGTFKVSGHSCGGFTGRGGGLVTNE